MFLIWLFSLSVFAENGPNMIGIDTTSRSMGGIGTAHFTGIGSAMTKNPATLGAIKGREFYFGLTQISASIEADGGPTFGNAGLKKSSGDVPLNGYLGYGYQFNDRLNLAIGLGGIAGNAVDFKNDQSVDRIKNMYGVLRIAPIISYKLDDSAWFKNTWVGFSPFYNYGQMEVNYGFVSQSTNEKKSAGAAGVMIGAMGTLQDVWNVGLAFTTAVDVEYSGVVDLDAFGQSASTAVDNLHAEQPAEYALGVARAITDKVTMSFDVRQIMWSKTKLFGELGWIDQTALSLGAQYTVNPQWIVRGGYHYAKAPIEKNTSETSWSGTNADFSTNKSLQGHTLFNQYNSLINVAMTPAVSQNHLTLGLAYKPMEALSLDLAYVQAFEDSTQRSGSGSNLAGNASQNYSFKNQVSLSSITLGLSYGF